MKLQIKVCGPRASGKTTLMCKIRQMLTDLGLDTQVEICEEENTENLTVYISKHDLRAIQAVDAPRQD